MDIVADVNIKIQLNKIIAKETVNGILVYRLRKAKNVNDSSKYSNLSNCTYTKHIKNDFKSIYENKTLNATINTNTRKTINF